MNYKDVEILLVEDNPHDVELTLRALKKHNLANKVQVVKDGAEALDFIFNTGSFDGQTNRLKGDPTGPETSQGERSGGTPEAEAGGAHQVHSGGGPDLVPRRPGYPGMLSAGGEQLRGQAAGVRGLRQDCGRDGLLLAAGE